MTRPSMQSAYSGPVPVPETHTRACTLYGPDFCRECSHAAEFWVLWPCEWAVSASATPEAEPYRSVEVTLPRAVLDDLEAFVWERGWTLRQRPMDEREWYAVLVDRGSEPVEETHTGLSGSNPSPRRGYQP